MMTPKNIKTRIQRVQQWLDNQEFKRKHPRKHMSLNMYMLFLKIKYQS